MLWVAGSFFLSSLSLSTSSNVFACSASSLCGSPSLLIVAIVRLSSFYNHAFFLFLFLSIEFNHLPFFFDIHNPLPFVSLVCKHANN